jgi:hypothetical protein
MYQQTFQLQATTAHPPQQSPGTYERLTVTPVSGALGADVTDVGICAAWTTLPLAKSSAP